MSAVARLTHPVTGETYTQLRAIKQKPGGGWRHMPGVRHARFRMLRRIAAWRERMDTEGYATAAPLTPWARRVPQR